MPVSLHCGTEFPLSIQEVRTLWQITCFYRQYDDDVVTVQCVPLHMIQKLNWQYRQFDRPTDVLTFSYPALSGITEQTVRDHDVVLCLDIARSEARERGVALRDYTALLLIHAFLHATGMNHESSSLAAQQQRVAEQAILSQAGFVSDAL